MTNQTVYKSSYVLAEKLLQAESEHNQQQFDGLYAQLKQLCIENEKNANDHPEQWQTLADFTQDLTEALTIYNKAMQKAKRINSLHQMATIAFSMAEIQYELGQNEAAIENAKFCHSFAKKIKDKTFSTEVEQLLSKLLHVDH